METGQHYNLQVTGGNPIIHGTLVALDVNGSLIIAPPSSEKQHSLAVVTSGETPHTLNAPSPPLSIFSLCGPAGKGIYQLQTSPTTEHQGIGSSILHDGWYIHSEGEYMFLRHKGLNSGFWIAVPGKSDNETAWEVWWLQPSGATVKDFHSYVMIDVELVKAERTEREKEL